MATIQDPLASPPAFDVSRRFVRMRGERPNGFVEFDFAIGEPELFVEMILGQEAFAEFCATNRVVMLAPEADDAATSDWDWRLADATRTRFK